MTPLATLATEHNAAKHKQEAEQQRDEVAEPGEHGRRVGGRREHGVDHARGAPRQRPYEIAAPVDHRANPGRRGAQDWDALLGCTKASLGEMLRRAPAPEPGVVRRVEDEAWAVPLVDHVAGEDDLVAEVEPDLPPLAAKVDRARARSWREVEIARRKARQADRGQQRPHRQIFTVRDEVRLIVAADDPPPWRNCEDAVL